MVKQLFILVFTLFTLGTFAGGDKWQLTLLLSPSLETYNDRAAPDIFDYKLSYNVGVEYKYFLAPDFSFSTGAMFLNKGFSTRPVYANSGLETAGNILISARYIGVPFNFNGHFKLTEKLDFIVNAGLTGGYLVNDSFIGRRINGDKELQDPLFEDASDQRQPLDIFSNIYLGWNLGIGFCKYVASKMVIAVEPYYRRQINDAIDPSSAATGWVKPRLDSFCLDLKVGYYFNRNIRNYRKEF